MNRHKVDYIEASMIKEQLTYVVYDVSASNNPSLSSADDLTDASTTCSQKMEVQITHKRMHYTQKKSS